MELRGNPDSTVRALHCGSPYVSRINGIKSFGLELCFSPTFAHRTKAVFSTEPLNLTCYSAWNKSWEMGFSENIKGHVFLLGLNKPK